MVAAAIILGSLTTAAPATALVHGFDVSPGSGPVGTVVTVSGSGCSPGFSVTGADHVVVGATDLTAVQIPVQSGGSWSGTITIDNPGLIGVILVTATCVTNGFASLTTIYLPQAFDVTAPPTTTTTTTSPPTTTAAPTTTSTVPGSPTTTVAPTTTAGSSPTTTTAAPGSSPTTTAPGSSPTTTLAAAGGPSASDDGLETTSPDPTDDTSAGTGPGSPGSGPGSDSSFSGGDWSAVSSGSPAGDGDATSEDDESAERLVDTDDEPDGDDETDEDVAGAAGAPGGDVEVALAPAALSDLSMGSASDDGISWMTLVGVPLALALAAAAVLKRQSIVRLLDHPR